MSPITECQADYEANRRRQQGCISWLSVWLECGFVVVHHRLSVEYGIKAICYKWLHNTFALTTLYLKSFTT